MAHRAWLRTLRLAYDLPEIELGSEGLIAPSIPEPILDGICLPPFHGPNDHDDYTPLMNIVIAAQPRIIVELGTAHGNTVANICRACDNAHVFTVNAKVEEQTGNVVSFCLTQREIGYVYRSYGFASRVTQILCNTLSLDLSKHTSYGTVDLAIIDACHDRDYVLNDFFKVKDFLHPGGICLFHDTHPSMIDHLEGSYRACMRLRKLRFDVRRIRNSWWGFWRKPR
jgi:predicted O-methyltransferase YrrM